MESPLHTEVDALVSEDLTGCVDAVLLDRWRDLECLRRKLDAATVATVAVIHQRGAVGYDGAVSTKSWARGRLRLSEVEASRLVESAKHLSEVPAFAEAFAAGKVSLAQVG